MRLILCRRSGRLFWCPDYARQRFEQDPANYLALTIQPDPPTCSHGWTAWFRMPDWRRQEIARAMILERMHGTTF